MRRHRSWTGVTALVFATAGIFGSHVAAAKGDPLVQDDGRTGTTRLPGCRTE